MSGVLKSTKTKILVVMLVVALTLSAVTLVGCSLLKKNKKVTYDYERGALASNKVENAQYMPDLNKFIEANSSNGSLSLASEDDNNMAQQMTLKEFSNLVDKSGTVYNYAGAGKYNGYDIYDIKSEIAYVIKNVPVFNQWFRMPTMRVDEGYISIPYYEWWAYYLELSIEPLKLSITRVCWNTRSSYYDFDKQEEVEDYDEDTSFIQYEVMKINYYTDNTGSEVVESSLYSVGIDHAKRGAKFNSNENDYHPFEYQYLKNVKDKSLTKYHITAAERRRDGMDIRGLTPYGIRREFTEIDYDGYINIDVTEIDQKFESNNYPDADGSVDFDIESRNIQNLVKTIGMDQSTYESAKTPSELMDAMAKHIVDNCELKNNWKTIYKGMSDATELETIPGPFYGQDLWAAYYRPRLSIYRDNTINYDCDAAVLDDSKIANGEQYSLSLGLVNGDDIYLIATNYQPIFYNPGPFIESDIYCTFPNLKIDKDGEYVLNVVLTQKVDGEDVILLDSQLPAELVSYEELIIPDYVDENGVRHTYLVRGVGGKLIIKAFTISD